MFPFIKMLPMKAFLTKATAALDKFLGDADPFERPLLQAAFGYAAGILLSSLLPLPAWFWGFTAVIFLLLTARGIIYPLTGLRRCMIPLVITLGLFNVAIHTSIIDKPSTGTGKTDVFTGTVVKEPELRNGLEIYILKTATGEKILLQMAGKGITYTYGDCLKGRGFREAPPGPANPGGFDYASYLKRKGVAGVIRAKRDDVRKTAVGGGNFIVSCALKLKNRLQATMVRTLPREEAALLQGILFGQTGSLDGTTIEAFRGAGISHILSVSGLHIGLLMGMVWPIARRFFREGPAFLFTMAFLIFYALMTGFRPSVLRALVMGLAALLARVSRNPSGGVYNLATASLAVLLLDPLALYDAGFQLSFAATGGIIFLAPLIEKGLSGLPSRFPAKIFMEQPSRFSALLLANLSVTLAAQLGVLPLLARYFNEIPLLATVTNLLSIPLVWAVTVLGLLSSLAGLAHMGVAHFINLSTGALLWVLTGLARLVSSVPGGSLVVKTPGALSIIGWYLALILFFKAFSSLAWRQKVRLIRFRAGKKLILPALFLAVLLLWGNIIFAAPARLQVTFLSVGEGDAIFVRTPAGYTLLIDTGPEKSGSRQVMPFLLREGVRKLDYLILTHGHADHAGGARALLSKIKVGQVFMPPVQHDASVNGAGGNDVGNNESEGSGNGGKGSGAANSRYDGERELLPEIIAFLTKQNIPWQELSEGDCLQLEQGIGLEVLNPPEKLFNGTRSDANNNSIVCKLTCGTVDYLLAADAEIDSLEAIKKGGKASGVEIFKVPHHGSRFSLDNELYRELGAQKAVISVGRNLFGHPDTAVVAALEKAGMEVLRTDLRGGVTLSTDGYRVFLSTMEE